MPDFSRSQIPRMRSLTITQQDELMKRWELRKQMRSLYREIIGTMLLWVVDSENADIEIFAATGHQATFGVIPENDLFYRMLRNGYTVQEFEEALEADETPMNWMTSEELVSVVNRHQAMRKYFKTHNPGTFQNVLEVYDNFGQKALKAFIKRNGYPPEKLPRPSIRITGEESEKKKLKPSDHQPSLLQPKEEDS